MKEERFDGASPWRENLRNHVWDRQKGKPKDENFQVKTPESNCSKGIGSCNTSVMPSRHERPNGKPHKSPKKKKKQGTLIKFKANHVVIIFHFFFLKEHLHWFSLFFLLVRIPLMNSIGILDFGVPWCGRLGAAATDPRLGVGGFADGAGHGLQRTAQREGRKIGVGEKGNMET